MPFQSSAKIRYYQFEQMDSNLTQAIFTRRGGFSPEPWAGLNMGGTVGDDPQRVADNRDLAINTLGRDPGSVYDVWQVHGTNVVIAEAPRKTESPHLEADIILTDRPGVTLLMRFADCVPLFLHDPSRRVIGIVHAGWKGTVAGTVRVAVETMQSHFGTNLGDVRAAIGPSIGPDHYEVGADVVARVREAFGKDAHNLLQDHNGAVHFDLWSANRLILEKAGVRHIELSGLCTACHTEDWYSYRAEKGRTGRFGAVLGLNA